MKRRFAPLLRPLTVVCALLVMGAPPAGAQTEPLTLTGPRLAAASNFGQGWLPRLMHAALRAGVLDFRDAVYWSQVENSEGVFLFDRPTSTWPDSLAEFGQGAGMSLTVNNGHPSYDNGVTPYTPAGTQAFGRAAAEITRRFPAIHTVEVGNEFNSANFVSGPVSEGGLERRAEGYIALLRATHAAVKAERPEVQVLGGGVHSIPGAYLELLFARGMADIMDALAFHPYTTPPEQIGPQLAVMRRIPGAERVPLEVTEFGDTDPARAPHTLLKYYCAFALNGVRRVVWYPLHPRGDGLASLLTRRGDPTDVYRTYSLIREHLEGIPVRDAAPDPFTHVCLFGPQAAVIWGTPRGLEMDAGLHAFDALGTELAAEGLTLSADRPLLILSDGPKIEVGKTLRLSPQQVLADSYHQFRLPPEGEEQAAGDGFARFARQQGSQIPLTTRPGQERSGTFWTPYRGSPDDGGLRLTAELLLPSGGGPRASEIVHRYAAPSAQTLDLTLHLAPPERSTDGVTLSVLAAGRQVLARRVEGGAALDLTLPEITLVAGQALEIAVGPGAEASGDLTAYRFTLRRAR